MERRLGRRAGSRGLVFAATLLAAACGSWEARRVDDERLVDRRIEQYLDAWFRFYPVEATRAGVAGHDGRLGSFGPGDLAARARWLRDFRAKLLGIDPARLGADAAADLAWMTALVDAELVDLEAVRGWRRDPGRAARWIHEGLGALVLAQWPEPRPDALAARISRIAAFLEAVRSGLDAPPRVAVERAREDLDRLRALLLDLPALLDGAVPPHRVATLGAAGREAARAVEAFALALEPGRGGWAWGEETLRRWLRAAAMEDRDLGAIRRAAEERIAALDEEIEGLVARAFPGASVRGALASLATGPLGREELPAAIEALVDGPDPAVAAAFPAPPLPRPAVEALPFVSTLLPQGGGSVWVPGAEGRPVRIGPAPPVSTPMLRLALWRDVVPGTALQESWRRASPRVLRRRRWAATTRGGWAVYAAGWAARHATTTDRETRLAGLLAEKEALVGLVVALGLHAGRVDLAGARTAWRREMLAGPDEAARLVRDLAVDPSPALAGLGFLELLELRRELLGPEAVHADDVGDLHRAVLAVGPLPVPLLGRLLREAGFGAPALEGPPSP